MNVVLFLHIHAEDGDCCNTGHQHREKRGGAFVPFLMATSGGVVGEEPNSAVAVGEAGKEDDPLKKFR